MIRMEIRDSSGGYNTREEPRALASNECMALTNAFPGSPSPTPRPGCTFWGRGRYGTSQSRTGDLVEMIPFRLAQDSFVIEVTTTGVFAFREAGDNHQVEQIGGGVIPGCAAKSIVAHARVDQSVIASSTDPTWRWIFEEVAGKIVARRPNIARPSSTLTAVPNATPGTMAQGWYRYAWTFVNRGDSAGVSRFDQYAAGKLESVESSVERVTVNGTTSSMNVTVAWSGSLDPQATHVRVYRTDTAISEDTVAGLTLHWLGDIAIPALASSVTFLDTFTVAEGDFSPETSDLTELPATAVMKIHNSKMWIGGTDGFFYYSRPFPSSSGTALKSLTMFNPTFDFVKVSSDSTEKASAIGVANNDIYLNTDRSVGFVRDGDPEQFQIISSTLGTPFFRTMCEWDQIVAWLSPVGPVFAQNGYVDKMVAFKAGEVWLNPFPYNRKGFFHDPNKVDKGEVISFRYMGTWWIAGGGKLVGFHESEDKRISGAMGIEFADGDMAVERVAMIDADTVVVDKIRRPDWTSGSRIYPWRFLNREAKTDLGYFYTIKQTFRRLFVDKDPSKMAEPFTLTMFANFTDNGELATVIRGDMARFHSSFRYEERARTALQQHQDTSDQSRFAMEQVIPAGRRASFFDVSWAKVFRAPFDFSCWGCSLKAIPRLGIRTDSVSMSEPEEILLDQGLAIADTSDAAIGWTP